MDIERTLRFLVENAAQSDARWSMWMERAETRWARADANWARAGARFERNEKLTFQLIALMSQQAAHHVKLSKETDRRFKETSEMIDRLGKKIDAFVSASRRTNGHGQNKKNGRA